MSQGGPDMFLGRRIEGCGMVSAEVVLSFVIFLISGGAGLMFLSMFRGLHRHRESALASFQLRGSAAVLDFRVLFVSHAIKAVSLTVYGIGGLLERPPVIIGGLLVATVFGIIDVAIYFRWWRRFR